MRSLLLMAGGAALVACSEVPETVESNEQAVIQEDWSEPPVGVATAATRAANAAVAERLPLDDQADVEDARRGLIAQIKDEAILKSDGTVAWSVPQFDFLAAEAPGTVNPSLWRQAGLTALHGLFEVTDGVWQVRGYDLSVMTIVSGDTGWIVIDPLTNTETAAAAFGLVQETLGERPVSAVIYTHSHADHFGGARGIISEADIEQRGIPVLAPVGFTEHAVSENVIAGNHMSRRATMMFGSTIPRSPVAHVGSGLGPAIPGGTVSLVLPTEEIAGQGTRRTVDGVIFEFIDAAGTEAPAGFMFYLPEKKALCAGDVIVPMMHNLLTLRGAKVRDALTWSRVIDYVLAEYGSNTEIVMGSHNWPTWGADNVRTYLTEQRDIYRYIHDQTLRRANAGATIVEAAEELGEPEFMDDGFRTRSYYGTLNHNAKAVYQYYFGWWGGVPADYHRLPHEAAAPRYVEAMGGPEGVLDIGIAAFEDGEYRWAAEVFNHLVFSDPDNNQARAWLAAAYEQLGFQAESGPWRSYYLAGAQELRTKLPTGINPQLRNPDFIRAIPALDLFDAMAVRFNPEKMKRDPFVLNFVFEDSREEIALHVNRDVVVPRPGIEENADVTVTLDRSVFNRILLGDANMQMQVVRGNVNVSGDKGAASAFFDALDQPEFWFPIATP